MSDSIIIYYSLEGNIDFLARSLAKECNADLCRLETVKEYPKKGLMKFLHGGRDASFGFKPELKTDIPDLSQYQTVVIGCPVWAGKPAAPIMTFLDKADFTDRNAAILVSSAGGSPQKCIDIITNAVIQKGGNVIGSAKFVNPLKKPTESANKISDFAVQIADK